MTLGLDLTNVDAWEGGTILSPGEHIVEVKDAKEGTSTAGHPQLELHMSAIAGDEKGGEIRDWIVFIPESAGRVKQMLIAFGAPADGKVALDAASLVGKRCQIIVRNETYNGKDRTKVKAYKTAGSLPADGGGSNGKSDDADLPF